MPLKTDVPKISSNLSTNSVILIILNLISLEHFMIHFIFFFYFLFFFPFLKDTEKKKKNQGFFVFFYLHAASLTACLTHGNNNSS